MSITKEGKQVLVKSYGISKDDTGSVHVQCAILTERIRSLTDHLSQNAKDTQAKRGLIMMVTRRRKLLRYLESRSPAKYHDLIKKLGIRK